MNHVPLCRNRSAACSWHDSHFASPGSSPFFGEKALKLIRGELAIKFENRRIAIVDSTAGAG